MLENRKKTTAPLYWCSYEYQVEHNQFIPENHWRRNVDWVAQEFLPYGYDMVCTDGWIEGSTETNENGYVVSHDNSWEHDWKYWGDYCAAKGLRFGVYYNPLWVVPAAVDDPDKKVVGTNIPVGAVVDREYHFDGENYGQSGDRFAYTQEENALYWVDVTKAGAKEFVQGYVRYFRDMGVKFLRIDFLSWYEDGMDKGRKIGRNHGNDHYKTVLAWISEAAGDEMDISLVMPHLKEDGKNEFGFGYMARINEDCSTGGWENFSRNNRGVHFDRWSQYSNPFDGLIYWSRIFRKGGMIPDADMLRLNSFATDEERKTAVSLCVVAGAPVDIADEYDTIGDYARIYQNWELLELNRLGFVGLPLSSDPRNGGSQIWTGKLGDGTWIAALFNREDEPEERSIDFQVVLGVAEAEVRDLWCHSNLGRSSGFRRILAPHACVVLKLMA